MGRTNRKAPPLPAPPRWPQARRRLLSNNGPTLFDIIEILEITRRVLLTIHEPHKRVTIRPSNPKVQAQVKPDADAEPYT